MTIYIKNMVCSRCEMAVSNIFSDLGIATESVELGVVQTLKEPDKTQLKKLNVELGKIGFEILEDRQNAQMEQIKLLIIQKIAELDIAEDFILSEFLTAHLHRDYSSISRLFSQQRGITLEKYFILQKIEKVKELLYYDEFSLTEIAGKLGYKSVQHLSGQFRNVTGLTPSAFKKNRNSGRKPLDLL